MNKKKHIKQQEKDSQAGSPFTFVFLVSCFVVGIGSFDQSIMPFAQAQSEASRSVAGREGKAPRLTADEMMARHEEARQLKTLVSQASLMTYDNEKPQREKKFKWWKKLARDQVHFNTLTRFDEPAEIKGEAILFLEHDDNDNEVLIRLPRFNKIRRVESQQQSGRFMGSELSYSDIATPHLKDFKYRLVESKPCPGGGTSSALQCHIIESVPVSENVRERTGFSRSMNWIRSDNYMMVYAENFDLKGELFKKVFLSEIKEVDRKDHKWMAHEIRIENLRNKRSTILRFETVSANGGDEIADSLFTQAHLAQMR